MSTLKTIKLQNPSGASSNIDLGVGGEVLIGSASTTGTASQRLQVTGGAYVSGNVGLGATNPSSKLTLVDNTTSSFIIKNNNPDSTGLIFYSDVDGLSHINAGYGNLVLRTSGTERVRIDSQGRLAVGTPTNINHKLQVYGSLCVEAFADSTNNYISLRNNFVPGASGGIGFKAVNHEGGNDDGLGCYGQDGISFYTNAGNERARIDSSGRLLVGTSSSSQGHLVVHNSSSTSSADGVVFIKSTQAGDSGLPGIFVVKTANDTTSAQKLVRFAHNNGGAGLGEIVGNGAGAAAFASYSDAQLKENVVDLGPQLASFMQLRPVEFDYKNDGGHQIGFIAQEMQSIYPDSVSCGDDSMLMLAGWSKTEARLVKALQEAVTKIETLEAKVAALESA